MNFSDSMHRLLRLRKSLEHQEELKLTVANRKLQNARHGLAAEQQRNLEQQTELLTRLEAAAAPDAAPVTAAELHAAALQREAERHRERQLESAVTHAHAAHQDQTHALRARTRDRETLDALRDHYLAEQRRLQIRKDQAASDEAYLLRPPSKQR
ncbi:MAG: hypothetical protein ACRD2D_03900 [Terriglobales bacterium]